MLLIVQLSPLIYAEAIDVIHPTHALTKSIYEIAESYFSLI